jgi:hypothetical protein
MFLKLVVCPLVAVYLVAGLRHVEAPYAHKLPAAPLAGLIEMVIKFVGTKLDI